MIGAGSPTGRKPPFVVDYTIDGRCFGFWLQGPADWPDAERHLAAIRQTGVLVGSDAESINSNVITLWIDGLAAWLKAKWRNWRDDGRHLLPKGDQQ